MTNADSQVPGSNREVEALGGSQLSAVRKSRWLVHISVHQIEPR